MSARRKDSQTNLFYARLERMLNPEHHLYKLTKKVDWELFEIRFHDYPKKVAWPTAPLRTLTSLVMLKQIYHLHDEWVLTRWEENPYFQFFSGETEFKWHSPVPMEDFIQFQQWIGQEGVKEIREYLKPMINRPLKPGTNLTLDLLS